jgi:hypothetical protein
MKIKNLISLILFVIIYNANTFAQCAMCKSTAESDLKTGGSVASNLNFGILYLMAIPYLVLMVGAYFFFKKPIDAKVRVWKEKYFPAKQAR